MTLDELRDALERDGWGRVEPYVVGGVAILLAHHERVDLYADDGDAEVVSVRGVWQYAGPNTHSAAYKRACKELARNHA